MNLTLDSFIPNTLRAAAIVAAFCALCFTAQAASDDMGQYYGTVPVPEGLSSGEVQKEIMRTLIGREWEVASKDATAVVGYLKHRSNEATVTLAFDTQKVDIHCVGWAINKRTGERRRPEQPEGWLKNIKSDLTKNLNLAALDK